MTDELYEVMRIDVKPQNLKIINVQALPIRILTISLKLQFVAIQKVCSASGVRRYGYFVTN